MQILSKGSNQKIAKFCAGINSKAKNNPLSNLKEQLPRPEIKK